LQLYFISDIFHIIQATEHNRSRLHERCGYWSPGGVAHPTWPTCTR